MVKKGLCTTCVHDSECRFTREFPVWQCEEFDFSESSPGNNGETKNKEEKSGCKEKLLEYKLDKAVCFWNHRN